MKINVYTILYESMKIDQIQQISSQSENVDIPEKANCKLDLLQF